MATELGKAVIPVTFDKSQISRDLSSAVEGGARSSEGPIGSTFKRLAGIAAGAFAGVQVFGFFKDSVAAARESNKVAAQTEAVIKSTGGAAHVTASQFGELANSIAAKTGIDDESIQAGENLLATFTNIRNEVGKGNDVFNQATRIAVDMGAALGGDASSNAIQLGKALNDPIRGISALTRVGVTFTDQQREQITTMQQHGDMVGAQKVILAELNKEFGGSAEATATAGAKWSVFWGNIQEKVGGFLIPLLDKLAVWAMATLPRAFAFLQAAIAPVFESVRLFVNAFRTGFTEDEGLPIERAALRIRVVVLRMIEVFKVDVLPVLRSVWAFVKDHLKPTLIVLGVAVAALISPVLGVIAYWGALALAFKAAYDQVGWFHTAVNATVRFFREDLIPAVSFVVGYIVEQFSTLVTAVQERWGAISEAISHVLKVIEIAVAVFIAPLVIAWRLFHDQILQVVRAVWDEIKVVIETAIRIVRDVIDFVLALINGDWGKAWDAIKDIPLAALGLVRDTIGNVVSAIGAVLSAGWQAITDGVSAAFDAVVDFFAKLPGRIVAAVGNLATTLLSAGADLAKGFLEGISSVFDNVAHNVLGLGQAVGHDYNYYLAHPELPNPYTGEGYRPVAGAYADGTWSVPGNRGEAVMALVHAGETIISANGTIDGKRVGGHHFSMTEHGDVYVNEQEDIQVGMRRLELLAGVPG